jgi:hypothetical protein
MVPGWLERPSSSDHCDRSDVGATIKVADGGPRLAFSFVGRKALSKRKCLGADADDASSNSVSGPRFVWIRAESLTKIHLRQGRA